MLTDRMKLILKEIIVAKKPITSKELSITAQVSSRTIRNDINELNKILLTNGAYIKSTRGIGFELEILNSDRFKEFLRQITESTNTVKNNIPNTPEDRVHYIVRKLLLRNDFIKLDEIADDLYISKSTLQNDLNEVKKIFKNFNLEVVSKPYHGIKVIGEEINFRFCLSEYLFDRKDSTVDVYKKIDVILPKEEMKMIHEIILEEIKANDIEISDLTLNNLCIHFAIACKRIREKKYIMFASDHLKGLNATKEYEVAKKIVKKIEYALDVNFPEAEIAYITIHLLGTKNIAKINGNDHNLELIIDADLKETVKEMLTEIDRHYKLHLREDHELFYALALHIKTTINRLKYGMNIRNPMLDEIKTNYPVAFDAAILASNIIKKKMNLHINEDEIGNIALHISVALQRQKIEIDIKRCIIVCASGFESSMLLKYKLQTMYPFELEIVDTISYYCLKEISLGNIDFIITTVPIKQNLPVPVILVNTILGTEDIKKVEYYLRNKNQNFKCLIREEFIFLQKDLQTREEVIMFLAEKLKSAGYIDHSFAESVLEREQFASTCFGNLVAIPHPMEPFTDDTFLMMCTLKKPVEWGDNRAQFVCLLSIGKKRRPDLRLMYEKLINIIEDVQMINRLINCTDKREFLEIFHTVF